MTPDDEKNKTEFNTKHLESTTTPRYMEDRETGPLDEGTPWVLEFRVVGTTHTVQLRLKDVIMIGRKDPEHGLYPEVDLTPFQAHLQGVSRRHAVLLVRNGRITLKDLDSTNGTKLNGYDLLPETEYRVRHGDELTFGQFRMQVSFSVVPAQRDADSSRSDNGVELEIPLIGKGQHVLTVADDDDIGAVFRTSLARAGYVVTLVKSPVAAMQAISEQVPDAIVMDMAMPDLNHLDFVRYVRKSVERRVPVLVISGATGGFHMSKALEAGADSFLGKPVSIEELVNQVGKALTPGKEE